MKRLIFAVMLMIACVPGALPKQLAEARKDYQAAAAISAGRDLSAARDALAQADEAFEQHGDTLRTRDLAYVASRRADIAMANARAEVEQRRAASLLAEAETIRLQRSRTAPGPDVAQPPPPPPSSGSVAADVAVTAPEVAPQVEVAVSPPSPGPAVVHGRTPPLSRPGPGPAPAAEPKREPRPFTPPSLSFAKVDAQDPRGTVISVPAALVYTPGGDGLSDSAYERLDQLAASLKDADQRVTVEVHTDNLQSKEATQELSEKRARAVRDYLVEHGVAADRIEAVGAGASAPVVPNDTAQNRAKNRRVELVVHTN